MKKINVAKVPKHHFASPKGKFGQIYQGVSIALGDKGCPFDLEVTTLRPGQANCPYHFHAAQWELYVVISGTGQVRTPKGRTRIRAGDAFMCPPKEPHQIINNSRRDLKYYVIADNPASDCCYYPDSDKWLIPGKVVRVKQADYFEGEE